MNRDPDAGILLVGRGLRRRCPRCGGEGIFSSWANLRESCPSCGLRFEREPGYWVGAMIINTTLTFALFLGVFVGGMVGFWPDVPWAGLLAVSIVVMGGVPIAFYPRSKTTWLAIELSYHPLEPDEEAEAAARAPGFPMR